MTSAKQAAANRRNGQRSTGPRTGAGKARAAENAITHGLLARHALLRGESPKQFGAFSTSFHDAFRPRDGMEVHLVDRLCGLAWRQQRCERIEAGLLEDERWKQETDVRAPFPPADPADVAGTRQGAQGVAWARAFRRSPSLAQLQRYEAQLGRDFARTLRQLQDLQADRTLPVVLGDPHTPIEAEGEPLD